jgi:hypothetical protein
MIPFGTNLPFSLCQKEMILAHISILSCTGEPFLGAGGSEF